MTLLHRDQPGLYNGVSQQSPALRLPTQVEEQINMLGSVVDGVSRRPGTRFVSTLVNSNITPKSLSYPFRDSEGVYYLVYLTGDQNAPIEIYRPNGTRCTVNYEGNSKNYLLTAITGDPSNDYRVASISDYMMVVNRNVTCQMYENMRTPEQPPFALYWIMRGVENTYYRLGDKEILTDDNATTTGQITDTVAKYMAANVPNCTQLEARGSVCRITGDGVSGLACSDSYGDQASSLIKGKAKKTEDLPPVALDGDVVEITGSKDDQYGNYYLKYNKEDNIWQETTRPGIVNQFASWTMPHTLIRVDTNSFLFRSAIPSEDYQGWEERRVGDEDSAPEPSFIGNKITDIFYFKNRLGFITGQSRVLSRPNAYFDFWPTTSTDNLDNDPIDQDVGFNEQVLLTWAVPFKESLLLFTRDKQFMATSGNEILTPKSAVIDLSTNFPCSVRARPINLGNSLLFVADTGEYSRVYEYFIQSDSLQNDAAELTAHVPKYIPKGAAKLVSIPTADTALCWVPSSPNSLYVYRYYWSGQEKPQSSWSRFDFSSEIIQVEVLDELLYLLTRTQDGDMEMVTLQLTEKADYYLDRMFTADSIDYRAREDLTTIYYPYRSDRALAILALDDSGGFWQDATVESYGPGFITIRGDWRGFTLLGGEKFESLLELSECTISADGKIGEMVGRLQLKTMTVTFKDTGPFVLSVACKGRPVTTHRYSGAVINDARFSEPSLRSDRKRFLIQAQATGTRISISADSGLPMTIQGVSWEGMYFTRSSRTG